MQKVILVILGLGVVVTLGFVVVNEKNRNSEQENPIKMPEKPMVILSEFDKAITLKLNDKITFSDGLNVVLKEINDSRCPKDVQCIWAGEIEGVFTKGNTSGFAEIRLGTVNNK